MMLFGVAPDYSSMATTCKLRSSFLVGHGVLMLCLGIVLSALGTVMANPIRAELGYALAVVLNALCLVISGNNIAGLERRANLRRGIIFYLLVSGSSLACWLTFWLLQSVYENIRLLALFAGFLGLLWSLWNLRLAFYFRSYPTKSIVLCILGGITSSVGILLATWSGLSKLGAVTAVACYTAFIGIEILLTAAFLHRECEEGREFAGWQQLEMEVESTAPYSDPRVPVGHLTSIGSS